MNNAYRLLALTLAAILSSPVSAQSRTPVSQMEYLTRGVLVMHKSSGGNYINHSASPGGSKGYPCISADIFGGCRRYIQTPRLA